MIPLNKHMDRTEIYYTVKIMYLSLTADEPYVVAGRAQPSSGWFEFRVFPSAILLPV